MAAISSRSHFRIFISLPRVADAPFMLSVKTGAYELFVVERLFVVA